MEISTVLNSANFDFGGTRKGDKLGGFQRKTLSDISNLQEQPKQMNPELKRKSTISITSKEYIEKLQKENAELMKLLGDRSKLIELSVLELRKLRVNLQKVQLQNLQLAQTNSQMLAELNSGKDRLKVLQHDLACQNGLLKARKLVEGEKRKKVAACFKPSNEVDLSLHDGNQTKQTRKQSLGCPPAKQTNGNEVANKKRRYSRRQSTRLKADELEATEDSFEVNDADFPVPSVHDDPIGTSGQTLAELSAKNDSEGIPISENFDLPVVIAVDVTKESDKRRLSRRQSARFVKTLQSEPTQDSFEIEDAKFDVSFIPSNEVKPSGQTILVSSLNEEDEGNHSSAFKSEESRRSSVGRPLRRVVGKVQSYKETPLNKKMRRPQ